MKQRFLSPRRTTRQAGQVLIAMLAVVLMGVSYFLVSRLNATSRDFVSAKRQRNAEVLNKAKQALIGYVAAQANKVGENNPGSLPCPENPGDFDSTTGRQGLIGTACGSSVKVGRFPWRTLGLDKLVDADGEPLWYVVSPNFGLAIGANTSINSNTQGQLTVDGVPNAAIALIIAPGAAINVQASAGCTAWNQARPLTGNPDWRNYLECDNATSPADSSFVTTGPSGSNFNDQVMVVTAADLMPGLEAAIADRMSREIAPLVKSTYAAVSAWNLTASTPIFPFAAPFADPSASAFKGIAGTREGLLPMTRATACAAGYACPPVDSTFVAWGAAAATRTGGTISVNSTSCSLLPAGAPTSVSCTVTTPNLSPLGTLSMRIEASINPFVAFRAVSDATATSAPPNASSGATGFSSAPSCAWSAPAASGMKLSCAGDVPVSLLCGVFWFLCPTQSYTLTMPIPAATTLLTDHALTDPTDATTGWFVRNRWHELTYYATTTNHLAGGTRSCSGSSCISVTNLSSDDRAILILAGRILPTQAATCGAGRPSGTLACYLEDSLNRDNDLTYVKATAGALVNDRFVIVDHN